jgi:hypothetical protein
LKELIERKTEIVEKHMTLMADKQAEILKKMESSLPDQVNQVKFGFKLFEKLNTNFQMNKEKMLHMSGAERLQLAEVWSKNADSLLNALNNDPGINH